MNKIDIWDYQSPRPAWNIVYRKYSDVRHHSIRIQADNADHAMAQLTKHVGNLYYVVSSLRPV